MNRTATPSNGFRELQSPCATTSWRLPFAFTIPGRDLEDTADVRAPASASAVRLASASAVDAVAGGVAGAVTSVDASSVLFAAVRVLAVTRAPVAELTYVPVWVTRAESPIVRSTPGPSVPSVQLKQRGGRWCSCRPAGCNVTVEERDPARSGVRDDDVVRLVRAVVPHPHRVGDLRLAVDELHLRRRVLDHLHVHELVRLHRRRRGGGGVPPQLVGAAANVCVNTVVASPNV